MSNPIRVRCKVPAARPCEELSIGCLESWASASRSGATGRRRVRSDEIRKDQFGSSSDVEASCCVGVASVAVDAGVRSVAEGADQRRQVGSVHDHSESLLKSAAEAEARSTISWLTPPWPAVMTAPRPTGSTALTRAHPIASSMRSAFMLYKLLLSLF
jgi:hypothetical protein